MSKPKKDEVVTVSVNLPAAVDYAAYGNQGFENHTSEDYAIPFLNLIQPLSPIINEEPSAKAGMLVESVTKELFDSKEGVVFIPVTTQHVFVEWKPNRAGFVARHELSTDLVRNVRENQEFGKYKTVKGDDKSNDLINTFYVYGLIIKKDGTTQQIVMALSGTKIKVYQGWMNKARSLQFRNPATNAMQVYPLFAHKYRITTVQQKNTKGTFYNLSVKLDGENADAARLAPNDPIFTEAAAFFTSVTSGNVKTADETNDTHGASVEDEEIPFE